MWRRRSGIASSGFASFQAAVCDLATSLGNTSLELRGGVTTKWTKNIATCLPVSYVTKLQ
ncbi:hypothetical protein [Paraburkholderia lycopersici]|uniref:hypothetical protein n=1 Tax=Paraburkholderia lycopersici TaxID=416944 RepID=UPI000AD6F019|nr:hypothetical protein [Paraburkholderia lycopersici]